MKNFVILILALAIAFLGGYFVINEFVVTPTTEVVQSAAVTPSSNLSATKNLESPAEVIDLDLEEPDVVDENHITLKNVDDTWNLYTNTNLGISIKVPKKAAVSKCVEDRGMEEVPMVVFEDSAAAYITTEYSYDWSSCEKRTHSLSLAQAGSIHQWKISPQTVLDEAALNAFIKEKYAPGCEIESQQASVQENVFDIELATTSPDLEESEVCFINYASVCKYYPNQHRIVQWNLGQDVNFASQNFETAYDQDMVDSFRFLEY